MSASMYPRRSKLRAQRFRNGSRKPRQAARVDERKQIGHNRLAAIVLIGPVTIQTAATAAGAGVTQSDSKVICAKEPLECSGCRGTPVQIALSPPGGQSSRNGGGRFERLLIE